MLEMFGFYVWEMNGLTAVALGESTVEGGGEERRVVCKECAVYIEGGVLWAYDYAGYAEEILELTAEAERFAFLACAEGSAGWSVMAHCADAGLSIDFY